MVAHLFDRGGPQACHLHFFWCRSVVLLFARLVYRGYIIPYDAVFICMFDFVTTLQSYIPSKAYASELHGESCGKRCMHATIHLHDVEGGFCIGISKSR